MDVLLIAIAAVCLLGCFFAYTRTQREADRVDELAKVCERVATKLRDERARVTVAEREIEALRRELRKLAGKFYAAQREAADYEPPDIFEYGPEHGAVSNGDTQPCDNYAKAQIEGPRSDAARCECAYCVRMRAERDAFRSRAVPKTVRGQAELAKLNAGQ